MRWTFGFSSKKGNSKQDEAGPSTAIVPARHSTAGPSGARPPRPSSVAADAIAGLPIPTHTSSSVASAHSSERRRRRPNPTTFGEVSSAPKPVAPEAVPHSSPMVSSPAAPAEPDVPPERHVPPEEDEPAPAEPYVAPGAVPV